MKNTAIATLLFLCLLLANCNEKEDEPSINQFIGTSWTAPDDIASVIYGNGCTTTIEFLDETSCQQIDYRPNGIFAGTDVEQGTYTYDNDSISWTVEERTYKGKISGSVLTTNAPTLDGPGRIYRKD